jgi:ketosteroid isomerase-like protein
MDRLYNGDPEPIKALYAHRDETSQCGYWGGVEHGWDQVRARWDWVAAQFVPSETTHTQELLMTSVTAEMAYAIFIERAQVRLVDQPDPQPIAIRVTAVFRREPEGWKAVHRHGDSLVTKNR